MTFSTRRRLMTAALAILTLAGCGFHLRGALSMPFKTAYVNGSTHDPVLTDLRRQLRLNDVEVVEAAADAQVVVRVLQLRRERDVLSLNTAGKAREYRLFYILGYAVDAADGTTLRTPDRITLRRDVTYDDSQLLAKEQEEDLLYRDMEKDLVQQLMRRLSTIKVAQAK